MAQYDEEDFVGYGTPVQPLEEHETLSQLSEKHKLKAQKVKDKQGRERFHGAFTGGFSAGYYNTVSTEEGWKPSEFVSSRSKKEVKKEDQSRLPEYYMDDEDMDQFGIAPRHIQTSQKYIQKEQTTQRAAWDPVVTGISDALTDIIKPVQLTVAVKLLRLMGWKEGQGIGPRTKRKGKGQSMLSDGDDSDDELHGHVTFAPKDMTPVDFAAKDDLHGIGYTPLTAPSYHRPAEKEEGRIAFGGRRGISGKAFAGAEEDEDDMLDFYTQDKMSNYDAVLGDEPEQPHSFTKPSASCRSEGALPISGSSTVLDGFCLAKKADKPQVSFSVPPIPRGYVPRSAISQPSEQPQITGKLDSNVRRLMLGDASKDAGLLKPEVLEPEPQIHPTKTAAVSLTENRFQSASQLSPVHQDEKSDLPEPPLRPMEPLNKSGIAFKPFCKDAEKQARYEKYMELKRTGHRDAYHMVAPAAFSRDERRRENEEFERSCSFFGSLSGVMASRFTRSKQTDDDNDKEHIRIDEQHEELLDDKKQAAKAGMFGRLTRESYEWHPHRLLCRRFNIADPYPNSQLVGLPTVVKDKISAYNFLDIDSLTKPPEDKPKELQQTHSESEDSDNAASAQPLAPGEKAPFDLFKAVFQDSGVSSESSDESDASGDEPVANVNVDAMKAMAAASNPLPAPVGQSITEKYSQCRVVASNYEDTIKAGSKAMPSLDTFKPKFVSRKDRNKPKQRKTRWEAGQCDVTVNQVAVLPKDDETGTSLLSSQPPEAVTMPPNSLELDTASDIAVELPIETMATPSERLVRTPPIEERPLSDEDEFAWMPALPPSLGQKQLQDGAATIKSHKKHKHKDKHKKKDKKSHKSHKHKR